MPKPEATKIINLDGRPLLVDEQSQQVKALIDLFDEFRVRAYELGVQKVAYDAAINQMQQQIAAVLNAETEAKAAQAAPTAPSAANEGQ